MGGERSAGGPVPWACLGSSPHARGTHGLDFSTDRMSRFIPACAGNAAPAADPAWPPTVHPCMRGERLLMGSRALPSRGSSPHARGTPSTSAASRSSFRFIPAYAGNARRPADAIADHPVHPRMRGERLSVAVRLNSSSGSSPHARGTLDGMGQAGFLIRFIPACAGNAISGSSSAFSCFGSSPHARGTQVSTVHPPISSRFIPACAGNAARLRKGVLETPVHPRMRGERTVMPPVVTGETGSSPHARGTPSRGQLGPRCLRFIPACAGNAKPTT